MTHARGIYRDAGRLGALYRGQADWRLPSPASWGESPGYLYFARRCRFPAPGRRGELLPAPQASSTTNTGGWSASSSRFPITRSVLWPNGMVSPSRQLGTADASVGGSAGAPFDRLEPEQKTLPSDPPIRLGPDGAASILPRPHRDHTTMRLQRISGRDGIGEMRVPAWLRGSSVSAPQSAMLRRQDAAGRRRRDTADALRPRTRSGATRARRP